MSLELNGTTGVQGNSGAFVSGTAVASTSGTSIDFTSIPSWVKRVTVMFNGVSTNGTSFIIVQTGAGSVTTTGYNSTCASIVAAAGYGNNNATTGFIIRNANATDIVSGSLVLTLIGSNAWVCQGVYKLNTTTTGYTGGDNTLGGALDRIRITTVNGTDTFDAGSINILYE